VSAAGVRRGRSLDDFGRAIDSTPIHGGWAVPSSREPEVVPADAFTALPDPATAGSLAGLVGLLRRLKIWAGDPSYETIKERVNAAWTAAGRPRDELARRSTVANCFHTGRRRMNTDLVLAVVEALHPDSGYVTRWRQALRGIAGEIEAVSQVRVHAGLPEDLAGFTGRSEELARLRAARCEGRAVVISAIEGMAGVGKTRLAVHAAHRLHRQEPFDRVLFVDLRGFHPDPAQPPADPAAVLDGFLRLLGVPGHRIPHGLDALAAAYRDRLAGVRALVVLDNAATVEQVRPLLPATPGCLTLVTSRRGLSRLDSVSRLVVDVFTPDEAVTFLAGAVPDVPVGPDPRAAARIAERCGRLPLALSLITGHIRDTPGWTLTDHADRLDERHVERRLDAGVELAFDLSYRNLPAERRRLLRLAALHPGQDLDAFAAAALAGTDLSTAQAWLDHLLADQLLQQATPGRYSFHDLVRAYAAGRAHDEDRRQDRHAALTRLFDHYLAAAAAAMNALHPAEAHRRPSVPPPAGPSPDLTDPDTARAWLDTERPTLVAVAAHTATHGWFGHTTRLAHILFRYLAGGHHTDALAVHGHALRAARRRDNPAEQADALRALGTAHLYLGRLGPAADHLRRALCMFRQADDPAGQARTLYNLGIVAERSGRYRETIDSMREALPLYRQVGDRTGETLALTSLALALGHLSRFPEAADFSRRALDIARETGNRDVEAYALNILGTAETGAGRYGPARDALERALALHRQLGRRVGELSVLDGLGLLHTRLGRPDEAGDLHHRALAIAREIAAPSGETWALNGLGEAALAAGKVADALSHHAAACDIATDSGDVTQQARAHAGLGEAHRARGDAVQARTHYERALALYTDLDLPDAVRTCYEALGSGSAGPLPATSG
jgi:tetratricopeptide (TPR) repeat protein